MYLLDKLSHENCLGINDTAFWSRPSNFLAMFRIISFQFFLLVLILFLVNRVEPISRHRHTFFFENNSLDAFTEDTIQILGEHHVRVGNFTGIREWKIITTPEELIKVVKAALSVGFKVQMTI